MRRTTILMIVLLSGLIVAPVTGQNTSTNLRLIVERESFTIFVSANDPISLAGLSFRVVNSQGTFQSFELSESFDILRLTQSIAQPNTCFIYELDGSNPPLPSVCSNPSLIFRRSVPRVDAFWYDFTANRQRDIAIQSLDELTGVICPSTVVDCRIQYEPPEILPTPQPTQVPSENVGSFPDDVVFSNQEWQPVTRVFDDVEMVLVPPGCFMMGSSDSEFDFTLELCEASAGVSTCQQIPFDREIPQHEICFEEYLWIDKYEVTNVQYGSSGNSSLALRPRDSVSWFQAVVHCEVRNARLPTEAEWEYAARGPDSLIYPWGNEFLFRNVVYKNNSGNQTTNVTRNEVGASWVGAHHMSGNLWEWTNSLFREYPYDEGDGRESPDEGTVRVIRGGSWGDGDSIVRSAYRGIAAPAYTDIYTGFRCAREVEPNDLDN